AWQLQLASARAAQSQFSDWCPEASLCPPDPVAQVRACAQPGADGLVPGKSFSQALWSCAKL
ncbi:MAG: hypothetical protein NTW32_19760, partial [Chloroflexi bacterium]|nr:hypothetical protein [Chloroflexota bacterium]